MWILTVKGYVSVVKWHDKKQGELAVRGRVRSHLEYVRSLNPETADAEIHVSPGSDYRYRFFASKEQVAEIAANAVRQITYNNFKSAVLKTQGKTRYEHALHNVWDDLSVIQPGGPYGWGGAKYPQIPAGEPVKPTFSSWAGKRLCRGKTKKGKFCNHRATENGYCQQHQGQVKQDKGTDGPKQITSGPPVTVIQPSFDDMDIFDTHDDGVTWTELGGELFDEPRRDLVCDECGVQLESRHALVIGNEVTCRNVAACIERVEAKSKPKKVTRARKATQQPKRRGARRG